MKTDQLLSLFDNACFDHMSPTCHRSTQGVLSIMPNILEISVGIQMERSVSVSSDWNIQDHLWRWSTYFGWNILTDPPVLCPNKYQGIPKRNKKWQEQFLLVGLV